MLVPTSTFPLTALSKSNIVTNKQLGQWFIYWFNDFHGIRSRGRGRLKEEEKNWSEVRDGLSKCARSDWEAFWLQPVDELWPAYSQNQARSYMLDWLPASGSVPFFQRSYCVRQAQIQLWLWGPGFCQMHLIWKQASVQESLGLVLAERN